jgi:hypothetical protein
VIVLSDSELTALTGRKRAREQLAELHRCGFVRARMSPAGGVILERSHYEAVTAGARQERPKVRPVLRRVA